MLLVTGARILVSKYYFIDQKNNFKKLSEKTWKNTYVISSLITGTLWGLLILLVDANAEPIMISMFYIILTAVMAGSITVLTVVFSAFYIYVTPIFLALFAFSMDITTKQALYLSVATILYYVFIIIIEQVQDIGNLDALLKKIMKTTSQTITIDSHELSTSASIGISIYPDDGQNTEQLLRNADAAMHYVKENGRHQYHFYTRDLTAAAYDHVTLETDLKRAIAAGQIPVYYQPQICLDTKKVIGAEALVRWNHPDLGILAPKQFLHIAEKSGLMKDIGEHVLTTACGQIVKWKQQGLPIETVSVNIAGDQIHRGDLVEKVKVILQRTGCKTDWLELEITEDFILKKTKQAIYTLQKLRDLDISLAIDDFGTGYSSLSYLKQLPINKLKSTAHSSAI